MRARHGAEVAWGDSEHLAAMTVDALAHLNWTVATIAQAFEIFRNVPKRPPAPVRRPTDIAAAAETARRNNDERTTFTGGSFSPEELDRIIERQTGAPRGIAQEEG